MALLLLLQSGLIRPHSSSLPPARQAGEEPRSKEA